ncbi:hypothetical protein BDR04DRAFT_1110695 [Suillus decipiens]|nr:hypothetical protein BDR04DRAFT_1110695 [Suillus decipiens]
MSRTAAALAQTILPALVLTHSRYFSTIARSFRHIYQSSFMTGLGSGVPIVILLPAINALARAHGMGWAAWLAIFTQHLLMVMSYAFVVSFIRASAPNCASIGTRMVASACAGAVFSYSMQNGRDL